MTGFGDLFFKTKKQRLSYRTTGAIIALAGAVPVALSDFGALSRERSWNRSEVEVIQARDLCQTQYKSGKNWYNGDVIGCADRDRVSTEREGTWRVRDRQFVALSPAGSQMPVENLIPADIVMRGKAMVGDRLSVLTAPQYDFSNPDPDRISRKRALGDWMVSAAIYAGLLTVFGLFEYLHRRQRGRAHIR